MIRRNYRDLVGASSDRKSRQAFPRHWHACQCQWQRGSRHAFRPIFYPLSFCRSCLTIYLVFQTSYVITLARTWAERGRSQPPGISGVLIDISVRAFSARRSAAARIKVDKGRKDLVESQPSRLWNEILTKKFFELKSLYLSAGKQLYHFIVTIVPITLQIVHARDTFKRILIKVGQYIFSLSSVLICSVHLNEF